MEHENISIDVETTFSFQDNCSTSPFPVKELVSCDVDFENFLEMEGNLVDFDFLEKDSVANLDSAQEIKPVQGPEQTEENAESLAEKNSRLKGIQDELIEESSLTDLLLMGAEAVEAGNIHFASVVAMRLKNILSDQENEDNPLDRLALYFTQGLLQKCLNDSDQLLEDTVSSRQINALSTFQILQELSPYVKFAHFTANQAILEAAEGQQDIHVIDFDIMEGIQWPSLMVDLAAREDASLRITAIVTDKGCSGSIQRTGYRLQEFADSINLPFFFDQILIAKEEDFERIQLQAGQTLIANCMMNQLHMPQRGSLLVKTFFNGLRKLSPRTVVLVEEELFNFSKAPSMSFVEFFCEALDHYTAISDSILSGFSEGYKLALRVIEKEFLSIRILESMKLFPCGKEKRNLWRENYPSMKGFRPIPLSSCNVTQAKHLISLFNGGYWVQNEQCRLTLCWKSRPLTTASIWVPTRRSSSMDIITPSHPKLGHQARSTSFQLV